jgi:aminoglycoside 6-adenylyltransferase
MDPFFQHQEDKVFKTLLQWAEQRESVRTILLTSTRAVPNATVDFLSDYDVILIVKDIRPFFKDRSWLEDFGEVLVVYWDPIYPDPVYGVEKTANVTQYADGLKIDFTLWPIELMQKMVRAPELEPELDAGYRVLLDKEDLTQDLKPPTYRAYIPTRPTNEVYQLLVNDFFTNAPYMAKCLLRGELLPAKWCLDFDMKHVHLRPMLEWRVGVEHNWSVPTDSLGKGLKKQLPPEIWSRLEDTYAGASAQENWEALFRTMTFFRQVAMEVGAGLGYEYPLALDQRVTAFVQKMHTMRS